MDCGYSEPPRRSGSNEYPQSMFLSRNKKNNLYPCEHQFYYIKVGFKGVKIIYGRRIFVMERTFSEGRAQIVKNLPSHYYSLKNALKFQKV